MTGTQASLPTQARHSLSLFPSSPLNMQVSQGKGKGFSSRKSEPEPAQGQAETGAYPCASLRGGEHPAAEVGLQQCVILHAKLAVGVWKCRVKFRDCSGRRRRNRAIPLAGVTFHLYIPAVNLIWNLERL